MAQRVKIFDLLVLTFKDSKFMGIYVMITTVKFFANWTCS